MNRNHDEFWRAACDRAAAVISKLHPVHPARSFAGWTVGVEVYSSHSLNTDAEALATKADADGFKDEVDGHFDREGKRIVVHVDTRTRAPGAMYDEEDIRSMLAAVDPNTHDDPEVTVARWIVEAVGRATTPKSWAVKPQAVHDPVSGLVLSFLLHDNNRAQLRIIGPHGRRDFFFVNGKYDGAGTDISG